MIIIPVVALVGTVVTVLTVLTVGVVAVVGDSVVNVVGLLVLSTTHTPTRTYRHLFKSFVKRDMKLIRRNISLTFDKRSFQRSF